MKRGSRFRWRYMWRRRTIRHIGTPIRHISIWIKQRRQCSASFQMLKLRSDGSKYFVKSSPDWALVVWGAAQLFQGMLVQSKVGVESIKKYFTNCLEDFVWSTIGMRVLCCKVKILVELLYNSILFASF